MPLTVAFQMDHIARITIRGDSTFALMLEGERRGHRQYHYTPDRLTMRDGRVEAMVEPVSVRDVKDVYGGAKRVYRWLKGTDKAKDARKAANGTNAKVSRKPSTQTKRQADKAATDADGRIRCQYCGKEVRGEAGSPASKEYDHVMPYSRGGDSSIDNINVSCRTCNRSKGAKTPQEWQARKEQ